MTYDGVLPDEAVKLAADLCRRFEGLSLKPYLCPAGVPTIGYGSTRYEDGKPVSLKDRPITQALADELLLLTLCRDYMPGVLKLSPTLEQHNGALAAITDFAYNLGVLRYAGSTLRRRVDAKDWAGARAELAKWVNGGGKRLPGLATRRAAEAALLP